MSTPSAPSVAVPLRPPAEVTAKLTPAACPPAEVTVSASPSGSLSFASRFRLTAVSSSVSPRSSTATGASFRPCTVTVAFAVAVPPLPSEIS